MIFSRPKFVVCATLFLLVLAIPVARTLPVSLYPPVSNPVIRASLYYDDGNEQFIQEWGVEIENSLKTIEGVESVEGRYQNGKVDYFVSFFWGIDDQIAKEETETVISFYQSRLPKYLPPSKTTYFNPGTENYIALKSSHLDSVELSEVIENSLLQKIESIPGVDRAWVSTVSNRYAHIKLDPYKLVEHGVSIDEIRLLLDRHRFDYRIGDFKTDTKGEISIYSRQALRSKESIQELNVYSSNGSAINLTEIATVSISEEASDRFFLHEGAEVVAVAMWPKPTANLYEVSNQFNEAVLEFSKDHGDLIVLNNPVQFIESAIDSILISIGIGLLSAAIVVFIFYREVNATVIVCLAMPVSLMISFLLMKLSGVGINLLSLGAMSVTIGMSVDGAVVVYDSFKRNIKSARSFTNIAECVENSTAEVSRSVITSIVTSSVIFIPLIFTEPLVKALVGDLAKVACSVLISSLFVCLVLIPAVLVLVYRNAKNNGPSNSTLPEIVEEKLNSTRDGNGIVIAALNSPAVPAGLTLFIILALLLATPNILPLIKHEVIADPKAEIIDVGLHFHKNGLSKSEKIEIISTYTADIERLLGAHVKYLYIDVRKNTAYISTHLKTYKSFEESFAILNEKLSSNSKVEVEVTPWITSSLKISSKPDLTLLVNSGDMNIDREATIELNKYLTKETNIERVKVVPTNRKLDSVVASLRPAIQNSISSGEMGAVDFNSILRFSSYLVQEQNIFDVNFGGKNIPLKISIDNYMHDDSSFTTVPMSLDNEIFLLSDFIELESDSSWREIYTRNGRVSNKIEVWLGDSNETDKKRLVSALKEELRIKYPDISIPVIGLHDSDSMLKSTKSLLWAIIASIVLVLLVLLFHFNSLYDTLLASIVIFFGFSGAIFSLYFFNSTISLNSLLGILILSGLTVNSAIMLIDFYRRYIELGATSIEAISLSIRRRFRALIVTTATTLLGMLPLAIGLGAGQDIIKPLGISISLGLVVSTLLTLVFVPCALRLRSLNIIKGLDSA
ncbi:efflux RND transporter permease subunit [Microbulbifer sp.]|uniref:efflux RND transporter permease subunit n=1 Tax=Microbulbifer sp. TaxID=1908541 RepID=UPI0025890566|nr:efflux RND transporter permease subunit [Microbulbifer sp.]